jgi:hypothetical protein
MLYSQVGKTAIMNGQTLKSTGLSDAGPVFIPLPGGETAIYNSSGTLANYRHAVGRGYLASTVVPMPPRGRNSPRTTAQTGLQALTTSLRTWLTIFS